MGEHGRDTEYMLNRSYGVLYEVLYEVHTVAAGRQWPGGVIGYLCPLGEAGREVRTAGRHEAVPSPDGGQI